MDQALIKQTTDGEKISWIADNAWDEATESVQLSYLCTIGGYPVKLNTATNKISSMLGDQILEEEEADKDLKASIESFLSLKAQIEEAEAKEETVEPMVEDEIVKFSGKLTEISLVEESVLEKLSIDKNVDFAQIKEGISLNIKPA